MEIFAATTLNATSWIIGLVIAVVCCVASYMITKNKGRNPIGYAVLGFFLLLIGIIVALVVPKRN